MNAKNETVIIKKYSNRRLYSTQISSYLTHDDICIMVKNDQNFKIIDVASKQDITKETLIRIICDQEQKGHNLLPELFLKQIIKCYDKKLEDSFPKFLTDSMSFFFQKQDNQTPEPNAGTNYSAMKMFGEITKKNMEIFGKSMSVFAHSTSGDTKND